MDLNLLTKIIIGKQGANLRKWSNGTKAIQKTSGSFQRGIRTLFFEKTSIK